MDVFLRENGPAVRRFSAHTHWKHPSNSAGPSRHLKLNCFTTKRYKRWQSKKWSRSWLKYRVQ